MLSKNPDYRELRKLRGHATAVVTRSSYSYWLGRDHLLIVEVSGYTERYRRFFFRDMQALVMSGTRRRMWGRVGFGLFLSLIGVIFFAGALTSSTESFRWFVVVGLCLSVFPFMGLIQNELRGPGALVTLVTAVQTTPLPGITRWRRAELLLAELKPLVEAAEARAAAPAPEPAAAAAVSPAPESTTAAAPDAPSQGI